jgi:hypothetical protein
MESSKSRWPTSKQKKSGTTLGASPLTPKYAWDNVAQNENIFGTGTAGEYGAGMLWKVSMFPFYFLLFFGKGKLCKLCLFFYFWCFFSLT